MPKVKYNNILECFCSGGFGKVCRAVKIGATEEEALKVKPNGKSLIIQQIFIKLYFYLTFSWRWELSYKKWDKSNKKTKVWKHFNLLR